MYRGIYSGRARPPDKDSGPLAPRLHAIKGAALSVSHSEDVCFDDCDPSVLICKTKEVKTDNL